MSKVLLSLSGGLDSTTLMAKAIADGHEVEAVSFLYQSKHNEYETRSAAAVASHYKVPFIYVDVSGVFYGIQSDLLQSGGEIPEGHYEAESMKRTVVPGRNTIFAAALLGRAQSRGLNQIWLGVHAGDHSIYPDCRPNYLYSLGTTIYEASEGSVNLVAPFMSLKKAGIVDEGIRLRVPFEKTRTCYQNQPIPCGVCGSCQERLEAFRLNNAEDPLPYESREILPK